MGLGDIHISELCVDYIIDNFESGITILEFGSGWGSTFVLSEYEGFNIIAIENQPEWQNKYNESAKYINVNHKFYDDDFTVTSGFDDKGWYDPDELLSQLPNKNDYDLILKDGPGGWLGRSGFLKYLDVFNIDVPIIVDDIQRDQDLLLLKKLSEKLQRKYIILDDKCTGVLLGKS